MEVTLSPRMIWNDASFGLARNQLLRKIRLWYEQICSKLIKIFF